MKEIKLLEDRIDKLKAKDFDLDAWKQYTIILLARIFGEENQKIKEIKKIDYDYSSWALRDTSGKTSYLETCKKLAKEILEASIEELKTFGVPKQKTGNNLPVEVIVDALEKELKVSQFKEVVSIVNSEKDSKTKFRALNKYLKDIDNESFKSITLFILSHSETSGKL